MHDLYKLNNKPSKQPAFSSFQGLINPFTISCDFLTGTTGKLVFQNHEVLV